MRRFFFLAFAQFLFQSLAKSGFPDHSSQILLKLFATTKNIVD